MFLVSLDARPIILRRSESGEENRARYGASVHRVQEHRALGGPSEDQWINASNVQTGRRTPPRDVRPRLERIAG